MLKAFCAGILFSVCIVALCFIFYFWKKSKHEENSSGTGVLADDVSVISKSADETKDEFRQRVRDRLNEKL